MGGLRLDQVKDWAGLKDAASHWDIPSSNIAYADVDGHIGWIAAAATPVRRNGDGIMPVPGNTDAYEWERRLTVDELPQKFDPPEGYVATANSNILPAGYPHTITHDWTSPNRIHRIDEAMKATAVHDLDTSRRLQLDVTSMPARRLVPLLANVGKAGDGTAELRDMLAGWDCRLTPDSGAAALYEAWQAELVERVLRPRIPARVWPIFSNRPAVDTLIRVLESPDEWYGADPVAKRDEILLECLAEAAAALEKSLGPRSSWQWGRLHIIEFTHPLSPAAGPTTDAERNVAALFDLAPVARGGDAQTPMATAGPGYRQSYGASYAQVFDLSDWDKGLAINTPGQSGQPGSPHYGDLLESWAAGDYFPLAFSPAAVDAATKHRLELRPA
jgi:penicillin amidase